MHSIVRFRTVSSADVVPVCAELTIGKGIEVAYPLRMRALVADDDRTTAVIVSNLIRATILRSAA